ncbi:MAG: universal stress protein [Saprospirales bacterium]|nr:universal stress protein [Saprospirales bacterium]
MKKIVFPTDFSEASEKALQVVKYLANKSTATIHLFHTYNIPATMYAHVETVIPPQLLDDIRISAENQTSALKSKLEEEGFDVETTVEMGTITDEIISFTKNNACDLLVMGTTGDHNLVNKLIGSNASSVLMRVEVPVLLVPKDAVFDGIFSIVYLDELKEDDTSVLHKLFALSDEIGAHNVTLLNVNTGFFFEPINEHLMIQLNRAFGEEKIKLDTVDGADVKEGIDHYLEEKQVDLVVMSTHKKTILERLFMQSNTKLMAMQTKVPLLVYHKD